MKNRRSKVKKELIILVVCLLAGLALNLWSVLNYSGGLKALIGQIHIAVFMGLAIYFLVLLFRLIFWFILSMTGEKQD